MLLGHKINCGITQNINEDGSDSKCASNDSRDTEDENEAFGGGPNVFKPQVLLPIVKAKRATFTRRRDPSKVANQV